MRDFEYEAPTTLAQALELMSSGPAARPLAGGTDLIDHVRTGRLAPDLIVDVKKLPELNIFEFSPEGLRLGAAVPCYKLYSDERIRKSYSALSDSAHIIGGMQIQSRASIGGNVCTSGPAADSIPSLIAFSAVVVIAGRGGDRREIPIEQFCTGPGKNVLQAGEIVVEFRLPAAPANSGSHYRRFIPRNEMDIAVVGVGAAVTLDESKKTIMAARIGIGAVAPTPLLAEEASGLLAGRTADESAYKAAAAAAVGIISPITDMRGTQEFRRHVTGVLVERVLAEAVKHPHSLIASPPPTHHKRSKTTTSKVNSMGLFSRKDWNVIAVIFERADLYTVAGQRAKGGDADKARDGVKLHKRAVFWAVFDQKRAFVEGGPGQGAINVASEVVKKLERELPMNRTVQDILKALETGAEAKCAKSLQWTGYPKKAVQKDEEDFG